VTHGTNVPRSAPNKTNLVAYLLDMSKILWHVKNIGSCEFGMSKNFDVSCHFDMSQNY
jgi:hypothetical protein